MNAALEKIPFDQDPLGGMIRPGECGNFLPPANDDEDWREPPDADWDDGYQPSERPANGADVEPRNAEKLLGLYHAIAAGVPDARFVMSCITPAKTKGASDPKPLVQKFAIGHVKEMADEARARGAFSNVYFGPALMRSNLPAGQRGKEADIVAVLSVVIDEDADTGKIVTLPTGVDPSFVVMTSSDPKLNRHFHFVFDKPLPPAEAKALAELVYRKCGGDNCSKDMTHIWRAPQTLNCPDWRKIERGRPETPQLVELIGGTEKPSMSRRCEPRLRPCPTGTKRPRPMRTRSGPAAAQRTGTNSWRVSSQPCAPKSMRRARTAPRIASLL